MLNHRNIFSDFLKFAGILTRLATAVTRRTKICAQEERGRGLLLSTGKVNGRVLLPSQPYRIAEGTGIGIDQYYIVILTTLVGSNFRLEWSDSEKELKTW